MSKPKIYERPWVVERGDKVYYDNWTDTPEVRMEWSFLRAFHTQEDAEAHAERVAEDYEVVRTRKKEKESDFIGR